MRDGPPRVACRQPPGDPVKGGGEEQRLSLVGASADDAVDRWAEAHVEHPVGLIEHEDADRRERKGAALQKVLQATRRGNEDLRSPGLRRLLGQPDATVDGCDTQLARPSNVLELTDDLAGELAGGRQDQRSGARLAGLQALGDRDPESERLARAGGRLDEHVTACEDVGEDEPLDGERLGDPATRESGDDRARDAEIGEGLLLHG